MILALKADFNNIHILEQELWPQRIREIPQPPKELYIRGTLPDTSKKWLCVVGSRKYSTYGEQVCEKLISGLHGYPFVIVSGLALGIDSLAHKAAMEAELGTVAIPGSGLSDTTLYPRQHVRLAENIIEHNGCLISEYKPDQIAAPWTFPQRNRLMVGFSHAVLVIEAGEKSGTLITARLGTEYNRDVLTIPGSIFSPNSHGPNSLLSLGATPITSSEDILRHFNIEPSEQVDDSELENIFNKEEIEIVHMIQNGMTDDAIIHTTKAEIQTVSIIRTRLELL